MAEPPASGHLRALSLTPNVRRTETEQAASIRHGGAHGVVQAAGSKSLSVGLLWETPISQQAVEEPYKVGETMGMPENRGV